VVEACATGRHIERVVITLGWGAVPAFAFLVVELEDVVVTRGQLQLVRGPARRGGRLRERARVMEVTERAAARDPAGLLAAVARARAVGWRVALDDVGAEPGSLAVLPFVHPDVIKLDLRLVQGRSTAKVARIVNAVRAQGERTGARILAEGIETRRHLEIARALGATAGQGWLYGRPGPLPEATRPPRTPLDLLPEPAAVEDQTPFEVVSAERVPGRAPKDLLLPMSMHIPAS
jgi:EAL domain-containing protein (putative c-di-GMP-specific phosphodiesterase class I)